MKERFYALDFLRASMMMLGVLFHSLILGPKLSFLSDEWNERLLTLLMENSHTFRMPLFFCLSGFLSSMLVSKLGSRKFLMNRFHRLFLPFLFSMITIGFLSNQLNRAFVFLQSGYDGSAVFRMIISFYDFGWRNFGPSHLWFLYYLLLFIPAILSFHFLIAQLPASVFAFVEKPS